MGGEALWVGFLPWHPQLRGVHTHPHLCVCRQDGAASGGAGLPPHEDSVPKAQGECSPPGSNAQRAGGSRAQARAMQPGSFGFPLWDLPPSPGLPSPAPAPSSGPLLGGLEALPLGPPHGAPHAPGPHPDLLLRAERSPLGPAKGKKSGRRRDGPNCTVRRLMVKVRDLGLGFDSDEIVPFKYCSGSCHRSRSNYDLTLATLLQEKAIKPGPPGHVASHPCCRPTRYEAVSFMNVQNIWQTVEKLSAAECKCIG
uniref:Artemin n=1 Tax=Chelonoidis abingdonii TaxID=106734 RepID=A0A8C0QQ25_CHEAB